MGAPTNDPEDDLISSINVVPLVDIFLVLLIIFMVTANLFLQQERALREIPLTLPSAYSGETPDEKVTPLNVIMDREGRLYLNGESSTLEAIGEYVDVRRGQGRAPEAVLSADKDLPYGQVARVIDFLKVKGIANLAINVEEQTIWPESAR